MRNVNAHGTSILADTKTKARKNNLLPFTRQLIDCPSIFISMYANALTVIAVSNWLIALPDFLRLTVHMITQVYLRAVKYVGMHTH